jgi:hypothetical protein
LGFQLHIRNFGHLAILAKIVNEKKTETSEGTGNKVSDNRLDTFYFMCHFLYRIELKKSGYFDIHRQCHLPNCLYSFYYTAD